jgi:hypothetical protein
MRRFLLPSARSLEATSGKEIARVALVMVIGFGIYGFTVGYWRSPLMGLYVAVKMPLLIALTLGCNGLLNGLLGILLGSGLGLKQSLHALLSAFAISGLILGSVAPVTFFLAVNVPSADSAQAASAHSAYLLTHVVLIGIAGLVGVMRLGKLLESYSSSKAIARSTLGAWIAGNAFLGMQFSWILRPFFGSPGLEVAFLRDDPMKGSFYEAVWRSAARIGGSIPWEGIAGMALMLSLAGIFIFQIKHEQKKQRP